MNIVNWISGFIQWTNGMGGENSPSYFELVSVVSGLAVGLIGIAAYRYNSNLQEPGLLEEIFEVIDGQGHVEQLASRLITNRMNDTDRARIIGELANIDPEQREHVVQLAALLITDEGSYERAGILRSLANINDPQQRERIVDQVIRERFQMLNGVMQCLYSDITSRPLGLLMQLFRFLQTTRGYFPRISYLDSLGQDAGGLRRDFVANLMRSLFASVSGLPLRREDEGVLPLIIERENDQYYEALGAVFAAILMQDSITTGTYFHPVLFQMLHCLSWEEMGHSEQIPDAFLKRYLRFKYPEIFPNEESVTAFIETGTLTQQMRDAGIESKEDFIKEYQVREVLLAILCMAKSIHRFLNQQTWEEIGSPEELAERIQGRLSKDLVKAALRCDNARLRGFFNQWIDDCTDEQLQRFVQAATGSFTLPATTRITVRSYNNLNNSHLPTYSTCFARVNMPQYSDYNTFKEKLEMSLDHAEGFQFV